jgi:putative transposase
MDADFCVEALKEALAKHGKSEIFNTDQGSQFSSGAWRDNRMIERLWWSLKYECVYLHAFEIGSEMRAGIRKWLTCYNAERPHLTQGILSPDEAYASKTESMRSAAKMKS